MNAFNNCILKKKKFYSEFKRRKMTNWQYMDLEIQFQSVKCAFVTRLRKNVEQLFIPSQEIQGDYSVLM